MAPPRVYYLNRFYFTPLARWLRLACTICQSLTGLLEAGRSPKNNSQRGGSSFLFPELVCFYLQVIHIKYLSRTIDGVNHQISAFRQRSGYFYKKTGGAPLVRLTG